MHVNIAVVVAAITGSAASYKGNVLEPAMVEVPCLMIAKKACAFAEAIRCSNAQGTSHDTIVMEIDNLHANVTNLGEAIRVSVLIVVVTSVAGFVGCSVLALGPGPSVEQHWIGGTFYREIVLSVMFPLYIWIFRQTIKAPCSVTAACDDVAHELNKLRTTGRGLAPHSTLVRVEALERYVSRLGVSGLGVHVFSIRLSYQLAWKSLVQLSSLMAFGLPILFTQIDPPTIDESLDGSRNY